MIVIDRPEATDSMGRGPARGYALDDVAPVTTVTIRFDGAAPVPGRWSISAVGSRSLAGGWRWLATG